MGVQSRKNFVEAKTLLKCPGAFTLCTLTALSLKGLLKSGLVNLKMVSGTYRKLLARADRFKGTVEWRPLTSNLSIGREDGLQPRDRR